MTHIPLASGATAPFPGQATAGLQPMARHRDLMVGEHSTYRLPMGTPLFCLIGLYALGFLIAAQPNLTVLFAGKAAVAAYFLVSTLLGIYLYSYRVILDATSIRTGALVLKKIEFADVVRAKYAQDNDSGRIILYASNGMRVSIGDTINDFGNCARAINSRLPKHLLIAPSRRTTDVLSGSDLV